jgi:hypothetical protein
MLAFQAGEAGSIPATRSIRLALLAHGKPLQSRSRQSESNDQAQVSFTNFAIFTCSHNKLKIENYQNENYNDMPR